MPPKTELLVFNKKEIIVILALLVLVALFSFTLGVRMGKTLAQAKAPPPTEQAPLTAKAEPKAAPEEEGAEGAEAPKAEAAVAGPSGAKIAGQAAEDAADAEFAKEVAARGLRAPKPMPMEFPSEKRATAKYTLQVGSHRTVAEAAEQVSTLRKHDLDAFYVQATVPGKGTWYRVGIGNFASKELAERAAAKWKDSKALPSYIVRKIEE